MRRYTVEFFGDGPDDIAVGDKLRIVGEVTVQALAADLVDVRRIGSDPQYLLGEVTVSLVANTLKVDK